MEKQPTWIRVLETWLSAQDRRLSVARRSWLYGMLLVGSIGALTGQLVWGFTPEGQPRLTPPPTGTRLPVARDPAFRLAPALARRIHAGALILDSLTQSPAGRKTLDRMEHERPGFLDSLQVADSIARKSLLP